jgi:hypothetical protein
MAKHQSASYQPSMISAAEKLMKKRKRRRAKRRKLPGETERKGELRSTAWRNGGAENGGININGINQ